MYRKRKSDKVAQKEAKKNGALEEMVLHKNPPITDAKSVHRLVTVYKTPYAVPAISFFTKDPTNALVIPSVSAI